MDFKVEIFKALWHGKVCKNPWNYEADMENIAFHDTG